MIRGSGHYCSNPPKIVRGLNHGGLAEVDRLAALNAQPRLGGVALNILSLQCPPLKSHNEDRFGRDLGITTGQRQSLLVISSGAEGDSNP